MDFRGSSMRNGVVPTQIPQEMIDKPSILMNGSWTIQVDDTHVLPPNLTDPTTFSALDAAPPSHIIHDLLYPIIQHHDTAHLREAILTYLKLPLDLWRSVRLLHESPFAHEVLRSSLSQGLWHLMVKLRADIHFEPFQSFVISTFNEQASFMVTSQTHSRSASGASWYEGKGPLTNGAGRPALHPSHAASPNGGFQFSSPGHEHPMQTRSGTPVSMVYSSRNNSQSPWRNKKGKAPAGQLYVCPLPNCTKKGFKNVGNYINHMLRLHADHPRHDPETSLRAESSPSLDNGEEFVSPAATTASNSPIFVRHLSQDWSSFGEPQSSSVYEELNHPVGYGTSDGGHSEHFDLPSSSFTPESGFRDRRDDFKEMQDQLGSVRVLSESVIDDEEDYPSVEEGDMSFGMFQASIMGARRSSRNNRRS